MEKMIFFSNRVDFAHYQRVLFCCPKTTDYFSHA